MKSELRSEEFISLDRQVTVLLVSQWFYPAFTGAGIRFQRYAPGLKARGVDLHVFAKALENNLEGSNETSNEIFLPLAYVDDIPIQRVRLTGTSSYIRDLQFTKALFEYCRNQVVRPDAIHLLSSSPVWIPCLLVLRQLDIPIIFSQTLLSGLSSKRWKRSIQQIYRRLPLQLADKIVVQSSAAHNGLVELGVQKPIEIIPNGVDLKRFHPIQSVTEKQVLRKQLNLDPNGEIILFVGGLIERKGADLLLQAWPEIKQKKTSAQLVFVGPTREEFHQGQSSSGIQNVINGIMADNKMVQNIHFTGRVSNVEDYFRAADLLAFPSSREGMPNALLEAFASGLATVTTPFLGLSPELGQPGKEYVLIQRSKEGIADAIVTLLNDTSRRQKLAQNGRKWVEGHLDIEISLDHYASLYKQLQDKK